ncbi:MAG: ribose-phosphate pyrophosphokinase-like domain-containing protein [Burkholderiales bacterium]
MRLLKFVATLRRHGAARVTAVVPYLAYARTDRGTKPFDPIASRYVAQLPGRGRAGAALAGAPRGAAGAAGRVRDDRHAAQRRARRRLRADRRRAHEAHVLGPQVAVAIATHRPAGSARAAGLPRA